MHAKRQAVSPVAMILLGLVLVLAGLGGSWGKAYGQTAGPTPTPAADQSALQIDKRTDQSTVQPGDTVVFTIVVVNEGSTTSQGVVITDQVPNVFTVVSVNTTKGSATVSGQLVTVNVGDLAPGEMVTVTITTQVRADSQPGEASNTANVSSTTQQGVVVNDSAPVMVSPAPPATPTAVPTPGGLPDTGGPPAPVPNPVELPDTSAANNNPLWALVAMGVLLIIAGLALLRRRKVA